MKSFLQTFQLLKISILFDLCYNKFKAFTQLFEEHQKFLVPSLFSIRKGEVFRLPSECREVQVLSGVAWITVAGEDIILTYEEKASLALNEDFAIVSTLSDVPLILEGTPKLLAGD